MDEKLDKLQRDYNFQQETNNKRKKEGFDPKTGQFEPMCCQNNLNNTGGKNE